MADPLAAILPVAGQADPQWKAGEFFATGVEEIREVMACADALRLPASRKKALDFGCGVGRLTQALAAHFDEVLGVDISPVMIELANRHNRRGERCRYMLNDQDNLGLFPGRGFDLIYSNITLQHIRPHLVKAYLKEFLRVLSPGGLLLFHLPSKRVSPRLARLLPLNTYQHAARLLWPLLHRREPLVEMYGLRRSAVVALLKTHGGRVLEVRQQTSAGNKWISFRYAATRGD